MKSIKDIINEEISWEKERQDSKILNQKRIAFVRNYLKKYSPYYKLVIERGRREWYQYFIVDESRPEWENNMLNIDRIITSGRDTFGYLPEEEFKRWLFLIDREVKKYHEKQNKI